MMDECVCVVCKTEYYDPDHPSTRFVCVPCINKAKQFDEFERIALTWKKGYEDLSKWSKARVGNLETEVEELKEEVSKLRRERYERLGE